VEVCDIDRILSRKVISLFYEGRMRGYFPRVRPTRSIDRCLSEKVSFITSESTEDSPVLFRIQIEGCRVLYMRSCEVVFSRKEL